MTKVHMTEARMGMMVLMVAAGCHTWRERPVTALARSVAMDRVRVTTDRGARRLTLERATVRPDSVVGALVEAAARRGDDWKADGAATRGQRVAVAVGDVWALEERDESWQRTTLLLVSVAAVGAALAAVGLGTAILAAGGGT